MRSAVCFSVPALFIAVSAQAQEPLSVQFQPYHFETFPELELVPLFPVEELPVRLELPDYVAPPPYIAASPPRLPGNVKSMLEAAVKTKDSAVVGAVVKAALSTQPYDKDEIRAIHQAFLDANAQEIADKANAERERIRRAALLELWTGKVELGAFRATGNTSNFGYTGAVKLDRKGLNWQHTVQLNADYQKDRGVVSREQYGASYQPRYTLNDGLFTYGRVQYEKDRIQGFLDRYSLSGGLGYRVLKRDNVTLSLEVGPALRRTRYVTVPQETTWSGLTSIDFDWQVGPTIKLTQDASSYIETGNSTFTSATGLEAGMAKGLKARMSYSIEHETSPPDGSLRTDTISRFSLVYGF
jgi:putative salt-induced outer membrane protein